MKIYPCLALALLLAGCGGLGISSLTQVKLDKIHNDMSPAEVRAILGDPSDSRSEPIRLVGGMQTTYVYRTSNADITIIFKNDQMKEKHGTFSQ